MPTQPSSPSLQLLGTLSPGSRARVVGFSDVPRAQKKRLLALGLTPGTVVEVERTAPLGDPLELRVRGFHLGLRRAEANALQVVEVTHE